MGFIGCFISAAGLVLGAGLVGLVSAFCGPFAGERHEGERNFIALQGFLQSGIDWLGAVDGTAGPPECLLHLEGRQGGSSKSFFSLMTSLEDSISRSLSGCFDDVSS